LALGGKNDEFSFNGGNMCESKKKPVKSILKKKSSGVGSIVDLEKGEELEIDSQCSLVKDIKKNAGAGADGPSWQKSYQSYSQVSNRSQVDDLFDNLKMKRKNRRGRAFLSRNSTMIVSNQSQSQSGSRAGSQLTSRVNSARQTPTKNNHKISEFFTSS
jgi:hypothetical protein